MMAASPIDNNHLANVFNEKWSGWPDGMIVFDDNNTLCFLSKNAIEFIGHKAIQHNIHECLCVPSSDHKHDASTCHLIHKSHDHHEVYSDVWLHESGEFLHVDYRLFSVEYNNRSYRVLSFFPTVSKEHNQAEMKKLTQYIDLNPSPIAEFDGQGQLLFGNTALQKKILEWGFTESGDYKFFPTGISQICTHAMANEPLEDEYEVDNNGIVYAWQFNFMKSATTSTLLGYAYNKTRLKNALKDAQNARAEARREFYAKMVHELRTPLNAIVGFSDVMLWRSKDRLDEKDIKALENIKAGGLQLSEMITDTLDISKIEAGKMDVVVEPIDITPLFDAINAQMQTLAQQKGLSYCTTIAPNILVYSDTKKVRQVITNLISNAIKYTKQGSVNVDVTLNYFDDTQSVLDICVTDTGIGIPSDKIDSLFTAYSQVNDKQTQDEQGTGLGLTLVAEMVKLLKGKIDVESDLGEGSAFMVRIPNQIEYA